MSSARQIVVWSGVYALLAGFMLYPASLHPSELKFGGFAVSDSLDSVYRLWAEEQVVVEAEDGSLHNPRVGAPEGVAATRVRQPVWWTAQLATKIAGPIFGYNAAIFLSFVLAGLFTHQLIRRVGGSDAAALLAGVAFAFSPFHILQAGDHINLAQTWVIPLYFLALVREIEQPSWSSAAAVCAAFALSLWVHPYYGLFLLIVSPVCFGYGLVRGHLPATRPQLLRLAALAAAVIGVALIAASALQIVDASGGASGFVDRPLWHLDALGVRWYEWFLPPFYSWPFGAAVREFLVGRTHGSNPAEMTVFLGFVPLLLAVLYLARRARIPAPRWQPRDVFVHWLVISGVVAVVLSTRPVVEIAGVEVTLPSGWLHPVFPMLRALSRWALLPIFAVACLAGLGFAKLSQGWSAKRSWGVSLGLCALVLLEYTPVHARLYLDTSKLPPVYDALRALPDDALVLELPVTALNDFVPYFWQMHHGRRLYNVPGSDHAHSAEVLAFQASDLDAIVARAQRLSISHVVIHLATPLPIGEAFAPIDPANAVVLPSLPHSVLLAIPSAAVDDSRGASGAGSVASPFPTRSVDR